MSRLPRIGRDVALAVLATACAVWLRGDLDVRGPELAAAVPYLAATAAAAAVSVAAAGLDLGLWRFASFVDAVGVIIASVATTVAAVALAFALDRLEGVARSVPFLQVVLIAAFQLAPRLLVRARFTGRGRDPRPIAAPAPAATVEPALILGLNALAEAYLRALSEAGDASPAVVGIVGARPRDAGRSLRRHRVLGTFEEVEGVVATLAVHGVVVGRVILAVPLAALPQRAREALTRLEARGVRLDPLAARLAGPPPDRPARPAPARALATLSPRELDRMARTPYWRRKRAVDVAGAALGGLVLAPLGGLVLLLVLIDLGWPPIFWQSRLGRGGAAFRLYKFRTMAPAHDRRGRPVAEDGRISGIGRALRRCRLDELPQLWNVLLGDMALTGPRPLLAADQPAAAPDRLTVRPGVTGWAQVQGGRAVGAAEKGALDVWWIRNASLGLDLRILAATARVAVFGERVDGGALALARAEAARAAPDPAEPAPSGALRGA